MQESVTSSISIFPSHLAAIAILVGLGPLISWLVHKVQSGYREFLALGPGGTPSTFSGYVRVSVLGIFALKNPLSLPVIPKSLSPQRGVLAQLPARNGSRPTVAGIVPHRQLTQQSSPAMYELLCERISSIGRQSPDRLYISTSCFEKHSIALFSRLEKRSTCKGEVCHSHPSDGSLHLTLHPADVRHTIEKGWGERHPLARDRWWWRSRCVPAGFVMIYAPRDAEELESVAAIIHAAYWWVSGTDPRRMDGRDEPLHTLPLTS